VPGSLEYVDENDPTNPYHARLTPREGYFDFVGNHYVIPDINTCYYEFDFSMYDITQCGPGEIKVRHSFMAVDEEENAGYEPLYYPDSITLKDADGNEIRDPETDEVPRAHLRALRLLSPGEADVRQHPWLDRVGAALPDHPLQHLGPERR
jgi:hypothetical protein